MKRIILILMMLLVLPYSIRADDWDIRAYYPDISDSLMFYFLDDGAHSDSSNATRHTNVQSFDTTFTVTAGSYYTLILKNYYQGEDSATTWIFERDMRDNVASVAAGAIEAGDLGSGAITATSIAANAIGESELGVACITATQLGADAITEAKIADDAIAGEHIATGAIDADALANNAIGAAELGDDASREIASFAADTVLGRDTAAVTQGFGLMLKDTSAYQGAGASLDTTDIKTLGSNNPNIFYGPSATGSGSDTVKIFAVDTTGTPTALADVKLSFKDMTGSDWSAPQYTNTSGYIILTATANDSILMLGHKTGFVFKTNDTLFVTGAMTDTLECGNVVVGSPGSADVCRMYDYAMDGSGNLKKDAYIKATKIGNNIKDTCVNGVMVDRITESVSRSDSTGFIYIDVIKSKCLLDNRDRVSPYYWFDVYWDGQAQYRIKDSVPDLDSSRIGE